MLTLQRANRISLCCCAIVISGCAKKDNAAVRYNFDHGGLLDSYHLGRAGRARTDQPR